MSNAFERTYWANEVADSLGISTSALRKWSLALERAGYHFLRDEHDRRAYKESDLVALRKLKEFLDNKMSMENAVQALITLQKINVDNTSVTSIVPVENELSERSEDRYQTLEKKLDEYVQQQTAFNQALLEQLKERDEYIEKAINRRDQQFMNALREMQETRKLIAAAQEEQKKQKKWYEFWK